MSEYYPKELAIPASSLALNLKQLRTAHKGPYSTRKLPSSSRDRLQMRPETRAISFSLGIAWC
jgi:hypothetical protein